MKKILSLCCIAVLCLSHSVIAEQWPPANETPEQASLYLEKTYTKPGNVKVGVTLFISGWNQKKKTWNEPFYYGKIQAIKKNQYANGRKCDAFTLDAKSANAWRCLDLLLEEPKPVTDQFGTVYNTYYIRFDDPALNGGKPFKPAKIENEFTDFIDDKAPKKVK